MSNLSKLKESEFRHIKIGSLYPKSLLPLFQDLDEKAYQFRKKFPGSTTRIVPRDLSLVFIAKKQNQTKFAEIDYVF